MSVQAVSEMGRAIGAIFGKIKASASVWGVFRGLTNLVFLLCWVLALPWELLFNRRVGRRYMGLAPLAASLALLAFGVSLGASAYHAAKLALLAQQQQQQERSQFFDPRAGNAGAGWASGGTGVPGRSDRAQPAATGADGVFNSTRLLLTLLVVAVWAASVVQRWANWQRFRTEDQVHSFASGVPWWVHPPRWLAARLLGRGKTGAFHASMEIKPDRAGGSDRVPASGAWEVLVLLRDTVRTDLRQMLEDMRGGRAPGGVLAWIAATVIHPALVLLLSLPVMSVSGPIAVYMQLGAIAMFIKARIEKALLIETVYDLYDARLTQQLHTALAEPKRLESLGRAGVVMPGFASMLPGGRPLPQPADALSPEFEGLLQPAKNIEVRAIAPDQPTTPA